jgi:hypothetical protein
MAKIRTKILNPRTEQVWTDLEAYREFCVDFGYKFNEADLYNMRTYPFQQFNKFRNGKNCKDQWDVDLKRFHSPAPAFKGGYKGKR